MAIPMLSHVFGAAGFSGESFDIAKGYDLSYTSDATDVTFAATGKSITLAAGSFPAWMQVIGKVFYTDSATNPGPFTVVTATASVITVEETVADEAGVTVVFDGSADTGIIDNLLKADDGVLTVDAPWVLVSTGALGAARALDISALEAETVQQGSIPDLRGRVFFLGIDNTDIVTNNITISATTSIDGNATFVVDRTGDYLFQHVSGGVWRVNYLPRVTEQHASAKRVYFTAAMWSAGATKNQIVIPQTGALGAGEAGPHLLKPADCYGVDIWNFGLGKYEIVDVEVQVDTLGSGDITLVKAQKAPPFNGAAFITGII